MTSPDDPDATVFEDGLATLAPSMGGSGTPRLPAAADPADIMPDGAQRVRLRDVDIGGLPVPCYGFDPT